MWGYIFCAFFSVPILAQTVDPTFQYPATGLATMTHYELPVDFVAACGCTGSSTHYPTAALSELAYGSTTSYGPGCGRCFKLTLINTFLSNPPFFPPTGKSLVVKITDLCPGSTWCGATPKKPNPSGYFLNFDLAYPSAAIPSDFFPSNLSFYGYTDFGVWNISYAAIPCQEEWGGANNPAALGSVPSLADGACCPADPFTNPNTTCPSYSLQNGIPYVDYFSTANFFPNECCYGGTLDQIQLRQGMELAELPCSTQC
ncbi:RlpA-like double-psi beta-barrel-protein domain-containing protein-containing protein [Hysterangium stoloniferum]|nr:RlpA-like double-psi beta-barrel-protein domain-containing protein-containing protein [Hysterangium stoloniferum]